jgi:hypothetical protein
VPALALDALWPKISTWKKWPQAAVAGLLFLLVFLAVQWPFADFLVSASSANWFFGTKYFAYFSSPDGYDVRHLFIPPIHSTAVFLRIMAEAAVAAILSTRLGLAWGDWVREIRR